MKTNLFKQWIGIRMALVLLLFLNQSNVIAQGSLIKDESNFMQKLELIKHFLEDNVIMLLIVALFGLLTGILKTYDLIKKLFPKWFAVKLKPFRTKDSENFKILIVPSREHSKSDELLQVLMMRFNQMHKDENLHVKIKKAHGKLINSYRDGEVLGIRYHADLVIWVDYFQDEREAHIANNLIPGKRKKISFIERTGEVKGTESLSNIKGGQLLGDIDDVMFTVLGIQSYRNGDYKNAMLSLKKIKRKHYNVFNYLGVCAHFLKKEEESQEYYEKVLEINPESTTANYNYAILLKEMGELKEAEKFFRKSFEINPLSAKAYYNYARFLKQTEKLEAAEVYYKKALDIEPQYALAYSSYAKFLINAGRYEEAKICCKKAIDINPNLATAHNNYAVLLERSGQLIEANKHYLKALDIEPNFSMAHNNYVNLLMVVEKQVWKYFRKFFRRWAARH